MLSRLKMRCLGLAMAEASFDRRGFPGAGSASRGHLERVIHTFIAGYNLAVAEADAATLVRRLDSSFEPAFVGFAYEGTGLYFALVDLLVPRSRSRLATFTQFAAHRHDFITMVGAGFAMARVPFGVRRLHAYRQKLDPRTAWCLADGYGFHQAFFHWRRVIEGREAPPRSFNPQDRALFDAGVGRAMWWVYGADPPSIAAAISRFDSERRPEMWTGIGTALAYASGEAPAAASALLDLAGAYRVDLLSGIPLAAHMRDKGRNPAEWTEEVCSQLLGQSVAEASDLVITELTGFLESWQGSERDKWGRSYLALRARLKRRLVDTPVESCASSFSLGNGALIPN